MPNLCQIKKSLRLNSLVQTIVKSRARILQYIGYQYNLQPKTVKYIIFKGPKLNPNLTYEVLLEAILATFESLEKVPLIITVRERAES